MGTDGIPRAQATADPGGQRGAGGGHVSSGANESTSQPSLRSHRPAGREGAPSGLRALTTLSLAELRLFLREPATAIFSFGFPLVLLVVLASVFGGRGALRFGGVTPGEYYLVSYLGVVIGAIGLVSLPVQVATYRERGLFRRYRAAGVRTWVVLAAQVATSLAVALVAAALLVGAGALLYGDTGPAHPLGVAATFLVGGAGFAAVGILLGLVLPGPRAAQAVGLVVFFPFWLLSGAGPPPGLLHGPLRHVASALPLTYLVNSLRAPWSGVGADPVALVILAAGAVVAAGAALKLLHRPD